MNENESVQEREPKRFGFGKNWKKYAKSIDAESLESAKSSVLEMLKVQCLAGKRFLDIGCGSGLFSLAAKALGAEVYSFDYDKDSVECTQHLKDSNCPNDSSWHIEQGSVLDGEYMKNLGKHDVVYSWGVLHHTGDMLAAFRNAAECVESGGLLFIAIYNDQGLPSKYWTFVKRAYNRNTLLKYLMIVVHTPYLVGLRLLYRFITGRGSLERGMLIWTDMLDWLGGFPFEVATPEEVFEYFQGKGFALENLQTCAGKMGCNEFVFRRIES